MPRRPTTTKRATSRARGPRRTGRVLYAALVIAAVLALAVFLLLRTGDSISIAENGLGSILAPLQRAFGSATVYLRDRINGAKDYAKLVADLDEANAQLAELQMQVTDLTEARIENERLESLLGAFNRFESQKPMKANIISRDPGVWFDSFAINRGSMDGITANMAVITGDGLVGYVSEVGTTWSKVVCMIDPRSAVACLVERTRDEGMLYGQNMQDLERAECRMSFVPAINDISPGDVVITSGRDQFYPKGLRVGTVTEISRQQSEASDRYIMVRPAVDFQHIEEVLVLRVVVERAKDQLAPLITPTPRPTPQTTPTPSPTPDPESGGGLDDIFQYPDLGGELDEFGNPVETPPGESSDSYFEGLPEDSW